jgi:hypothetical protein
MVRGTEKNERPGVMKFSSAARIMNTAAEKLELDVSSVAYALYYRLPALLHCLLFLSFFFFLSSQIVCAICCRGKS